MMNFFPYLIALASVLCSAILSPMAKKVGFQLPPFSFIAISSFIHFWIAGSIALVKEKDTVIANFDKIEWQWFLIFSLTHLASYVIYLAALSKIPIAHYQMFALLTPIFGGLIAVVALKEPFHARYLLSMLFIGIGIFIAIKPNLLRQ